MQNEPRRRLAILLTLLFAGTAACAGGMPGGLDMGSLFNSSSNSEQTQSSRREESVRVNGREVDLDDEEEEEEAPRRRGRKRSTAAEREINDIGETCKKNNECDAKACWVGSGQLGYCTKMCNSFSDCPSFWKCKKPGNAPQKICMQD